MAIQVIKKLKETWRSRTDRKRAWLGRCSPDTDGLTPLQREAAAALQGAFPGLTLSMAGNGECHLVGILPNSQATIFVYPDGAQVRAGAVDFRAERWDYDNPAALIAALIFQGHRAQQA